MLTKKWEETSQQQWQGNKHTHSMQKKASAPITDNDSTDDRTEAVKHWAQVLSV